MKHLLFQAGVLWLVTTESSPLWTSPESPIAAAVRAETVTDDLLAELRAYFLKARHDPSYRFKPSAS